MAILALLAAFADLPVRTANGRTYVQIKIQDTPGWWLVDTGATHTVVSPRTAADWPRLTGHPAEADPYGLTAWAVPPVLRLGSRPVRLRKVAVLPRLAERFLSEDEVFVAGILGWDVLSRNRWRLDPAHARAAFAPSSSHPPADLLVRWPLRQHRGSPMVDLRHVGGARWSMLLDTGTEALVVGMATARRSGWQPVARPVPGPRLVGLGRSAGSQQWRTRLAGPLGGIPREFLVTERPPLPWVDGAVGTGFLEGRALLWDGPAGWWGLSSQPPPKESVPAPG
ncbi:MAG: hypothetical protein VKO21_11485 [Candidatus Sericytochromatia bacterium]|nr:hypothetical protein [Candidatus Sericytochromatia bacterium]